MQGQSEQGNRKQRRAQAAMMRSAMRKSGYKNFNQNVSPEVMAQAAAQAANMQNLEVLPSSGGALKSISQEPIEIAAIVSEATPTSGFIAPLPEITPDNISVEKTCPEVKETIIQVLDK